MINFYNEDGTITTDKRHTVDIRNLASFATAIQINNDGSYEDVTYMTDDIRTYNNEAIIDATEEEKEAYRKFRSRFKIGDTVEIISGRKMKGERKTIKSMFTYRVPNTFGHQDVDYLVFTDNTKANKLHCKIL